MPSELAERLCTSCVRSLDEDTIFSSGPSRANQARSKFGRFADDRIGAERKWTAFRNGLGFVSWGLLLSLLCFLAQAAVMLLIFLTLRHPTFGAEREFIAATSALTLNCVQFGLALLVVIGMFRCCSIPREAQASGWVTGFIVSAILAGLSLGCMFLIGLALASQRRPGFGEGFLCGGVCILLCAFAAHLCFVMILRAAAVHWKEDRLARSLVTFLVLSLMMGLGSVTIPTTVMSVLAGTIGPDRDVVLLVSLGIFGGLFILVLAMIIWYRILLNRLRSMLQ